MLRKVIMLAHHLCLCQFGNYIVSNVLNKCSSYFRDPICNLVKDNILELGCDKYASNVV